MQCERFKTDGMKFLDGEMTTDERREYEQHVRECDLCSKELREMGRVVNLTNEIELKSPDEQFWAEYWRGVHRRLERGVGFFLIVGGLIVLTAWGIFKAVTSPDFLTIRGIASAVFLLGLWIVFLSVVRERYHEAKHDPYKDVQQ